MSSVPVPQAGSMMRRLATASWSLPVHEILVESEAGEHQGRDVVRVEGSIALGRAEDPVVEGPCVVVPEFAQAVRDVVGALGELADRVSDPLPVWKRIDDCEGGLEHRARSPVQGLSPRRP